MMPRPDDRPPSLGVAGGRPEHAGAVDARGHAIADAVEAAWYQNDGSGRLDVPMAAVAALANVPRGSEQERRWRAAVDQREPDDLVNLIRETWQVVIRFVPEFTHLLWPMVRWTFDEEPGDLGRHAQFVARSALRAGQIEITGTDRRLEVDLLGTVLMRFRPKSAHKGLGQFYTPSDLADLTASLTGVEPNSSVCDPAMGTGGLFRSAARALRSAGHDPRTVEWVGADIDEIAVACATVNSLSWGLGRNLVFYAGNAFDEGWAERAHAQREELRRIAQRVRETSAMVVALDRLTGR